MNQFKGEKMFTVVNGNNARRNTSSKVVCIIPTATLIRNLFEVTMVHLVSRIWPPYSMCSSSRKKPPSILN